MKLSEVFSTWQSHIEMRLVGFLTPEVRRDMRVDLRAAYTQSVMATIIPFIPIILRRAGASTEQVAYYHAITALGLLTTGTSVWFMRRWGMKRITLICWMLGRGSFLITALVFNATDLLIIFCPSGPTQFILYRRWPAWSCAITVLVFGLFSFRTIIITRPAFTGDAATCS